MPSPLSESSSYPLWHCPGCGYHGIQNVTGGVGPWPGDGKVRCPSRTCEYATVMEQVGTLVDEARCDHTHDQDMAYIREQDAENERTLTVLRETADALKAAMHGERTWVQWDVLRDSWAHLDARGKHADA